jgi:hypothetical protein
LEKVAVSSVAIYRIEVEVAEVIQVIKGGFDLRLSIAFFCGESLDF